MSDYQACWIPDIEEVDENDEESEEDDDEDNEDEAFMSCESEVDSDDEFEKDENDEEFDTVTVSEAPVNDDKYDLGRNRIIKILETNIKSNLCFGRYGFAGGT